MKKKTTSQLKKLLDKTFSIYVRQKYSDPEGFVQCYTCGIKKHWREVHCGHFVSRIHLATRFSEDNTRPQCAGCNIFGGGKTAIFGLNLERDLGQGTISRLYREAQKIVRDYLYEEKIKYYQEKIKEL